MKQSVPKVAAVQDLSCVGRCSLTVIIPVLSVLGVQVCPLPTAILSSHLGGFSGLKFCDFTEHMAAFFQHWQAEQISFDAIYSGFLASEQQMDTVLQFVEGFRNPAGLILVDPVMGDSGRLYATYTPHMQQKMRDLIRKADVITPNYTEACFLLEEPYYEGDCEEARLREWLQRLAAFGPQKVVITGVPGPAQTVLTAGYDRTTHEFYAQSNAYIPVSYPGTGDLFASVLLGKLLAGQTLPTAIEQAAAFVLLAITTTQAAATPVREGVLFEKVLAQLCVQT